MHTHQHYFNRDTYLSPLKNALIYPSAPSSHSFIHKIIPSTNPSIHLVHQHPSSIYLQNIFHLSSINLLIHSCNITIPHPLIHSSISPSTPSLSSTHPRIHPHQSFSIHWSITSAPSSISSRRRRWPSGKRTKSGRRKSSSWEGNSKRKQRNTTK